MDCEKVRDLFSSLWEKGLAPFEEKIVREHLSSCPECQREFKQFEKTMGWLQSVEDVEVPDGFLTGLYKKMEERKETTSAEKPGKRWLDFPLPLKLPVQAVAMVAVILFVLYFTKMMPMKGYHREEGGRPSSSLSLEKTPERITAQKEVRSERGSLKAAAGAPGPKDVERAEAPVPREERLESTYVRQMRAEARKPEIPSSKTGVTGYRTFDLKEAAGARIPSPEPEEIEKGASAQNRLALTSKPPQEIVLKISDREKAISQLYKLAKQFGGEITGTKGDKFLASLPKSSFVEFEKELAALSTSDRLFAREPVEGDFAAVQRATKEEMDKKSKEPARLANGEESRIIVRILLVQE